MYKKYIHILLAVVVIVAVTAFIIQKSKTPKVIDTGEEYVIDLSSNIDTSDWPTFTNYAAGYSYKYDPSGRISANDPEGPPAEHNPNATYYYGELLGGGHFNASFSINGARNINNLSLKEWVDQLLENNLQNKEYAILYDRKQITLSGKEAEVILYEGSLSNTPEYLGSGGRYGNGPMYFIYMLYDDNSILRIKILSEYHTKNIYAEEDSKILKAMLKTFQLLDES